MSSSGPYTSSANVLPRNIVRYNGDDTCYYIASSAQEVIISADSVQGDDVYYYINDGFVSISLLLALM